MGLVSGKLHLDLDYLADSQADVDMNIAMTDTGQFVEIQGSAENAPFDGEQLQQMLTLAAKGIKKILKEQRKALMK